jgi:hypothetical protein
MNLVKRSEQAEIPIEFKYNSTDVIPEVVSNLVVSYKGTQVATLTNVAAKETGSYVAIWNSGYDQELGYYTVSYDWDYQGVTQSNSIEFELIVEHRGHSYLKFTRVETKSVSLDFIDISWEVNIVGDVDPYYVVLRSENEVGPFVQISGNIGDTYHFRDHNVILNSPFRPFYYNIKAYENGVELDSSDIIKLEHEPDSIALAVADQMRRLLKVKTGRKVLLFKKKRFGKRCECWSSELGKVTRSNCMKCFSTGWVGGFHKPMIMYCSIDEASKNEVPTSLGGSAQPKLGMVTMANYPEIMPGDIVVEQNSEAWRINTVKYNKKRRTHTWQIAEINLISPGDVEYSIPIKTSYFDTAEDIDLNPKYDLNIKTINS